MSRCRRTCRRAAGRRSSSRWPSGRLAPISCASTSRHVEQVRAESAGQPRAVDKLAKNRWRVQTGGAASVTVRYRVYGREMTVRTNFVEVRVRADQRRSDLPDAGRRPRAETARGDAGAPGRMEDVDDRAARGGGLSASLSRGRLRHARRLADRRRQSRGLRVQREGRAALPRQRRRRRRVGWSAVRRRRAEDRRGAGRVLGRGAVTTSTSSST